MATSQGKPTFFATPAAFRAWLERHHGTAAELWVGFHKKTTGKPSITWPESVDCALSYDWIDGVRKRLDDESYVIRFTPRKAGSRWSAVNVRRVRELKKLGLMRPAGLEAFARRDESKTYSYAERNSIVLDEQYRARLQANANAWAFFQAQPNWYRRGAVHWVMSAKKPETREKRLETLIADSAAGRTVPPLTRPQR